jgi:hypothetical protein
VRGVRGVNKYLKNILITILLLVLVCGGIYIWTIRGTSYKYSLEFIRQNKQIVEAIGEVKTLRLSFFGKSFVTANDKDGYAKYTIIVQGEKGKGVVSLKLKKDQGKWGVINGIFSYADGKNISLKGEE